MTAMTGARKHHGRQSRRGSAARAPQERALLRICGLAAVAALFERGPDRIERLFFEARLRGEVGRWCSALARERKPYREADPAELARIAGTVLHGGVVAVALPPPLAAFDSAAAAGWARDEKPVLVLDGVGNPHNLGAIARSAAFFGIAHIVLADRPEQALPSDASYRVAEGGLEHVSLYRAPLTTALGDLRRSYRIVGSAPGHGEPTRQRGTGKPAALVLGNEEKGLDPATIAVCDEIVTIPGSGRVQSLNVAAASAILLYAFTRAGV